MAVIVVSTVVFAVEILVQEKKKLVQTKVSQVAKIKADTVKIDIHFQADWNLYPILETHVTKWLINKGIDVPIGRQQKCNKY